VEDLDRRLVLLVLSFPAYLLLELARSTWRTQFLSGIGAAIFSGAVITIFASLIPWQRARPMCVILLAVPLVWMGGRAAIERGGPHRWVWQNHQRVMQVLLRGAPRIENGTLIVLTGVRKAADPFGDNYWFDMALRLAYPKTQVAGIYFYDDGTPGVSNNMQLQGDRWKWDGKHFEGLFRAAGFDQTLVLEFEAGDAARVLPAIPSFVCQGACPEQQTYDPQARIAGRTPSPEAGRRYGPL